MPLAKKTTLQRHLGACVGTLALLGAAVALTGCGGSHEGCTGEVAPLTGLTVTVVDSATGQRICDATVRAAQGSSMPIQLDFAGLGADCDYTGITQPGVYTVTVTKPGYTSPPAQTATITTDACNGLNPQALSFSITKAP